MMFKPLNEDLMQSQSPSSENRLESLSPGDWSPEVFRLAARKSGRDWGLVMTIHITCETLPNLSPSARSKYDDEYRDAKHENRAVAAVTAQKDGQVVGYGMAGESSEGWSLIAILGVAQGFRRSESFHVTVDCASHSFTVGVGHVIADALIRLLKLPMSVDATTPASRYIFKSLGFRRREDQTNPCILDLY